MPLFGGLTRRMRDTIAEATTVRDVATEPTDRGPAADAARDRDHTNAIALAIARSEGIDVGEVPPLYGPLDTDGLNAFLRTAPDATVTFPYRGFEITITGRGDVELVPLEEE